jgi:hypothetical protein
MSLGVFEIPKNITTKVLEKFFSKVNQADNRLDCWEWQGYLNQKGYGTLIIGQNHFKAHRLSYYLQYGKDPIGWLVQHKCDNPKCCNPFHLELGTEKTNAEDRNRKNRTVKGEDISWCKQTKETVLEIRKLHSAGVKTKEIATKFNVTENYVICVALRRFWKHI